VRPSSFLGPDFPLVTQDKPVEDRQRPAMSWTLMSHLEFAALPTAAGCARRHAWVIAGEFGLSPLADTVELIVSELVTNAVRATSHLRTLSSAIPVVRLWLASDLHCMLIRLWDASPQMPVRQDASPDDESGRGLMLVDCLARDWGAYREENGKVVWVIVG
jgi:anti-sigma regulatory factor (Ser/Thr protein kinase)